MMKERLIFDKNIFISLLCLFGIIDCIHFRFIIQLGMNSLIKNYKSKKT